MFFTKAGSDRALGMCYYDQSIGSSQLETWKDYVQKEQKCLGAENWLQLQSCEVVRPCTIISSVGGEKGMKLVVVCY
jgi:hypothetical protein